MSNIVLNTGSGGSTLGTDTVAGTPNVEYQIVKLSFSAAGAAPVTVSAANPLPQNLATIAGTAPDTNSGLKSAGTLRVVLATDQPALTNAQPVAQSGTWTVTVNGTVTANQGGAPWSINQTQWNGVAVDVNSGVKSAGTLRVVLATDQPSLSNALPVSQSGAWAVTNTPASAAPVDHADVTVAATTTDATIVANGSRKSVTICNLSANSGPIRVRLHASGLGGVEVLPGGFYNIQTTAALDVVNPNAASITYAWEEYQ